MCSAWTKKIRAPGADFCLHRHNRRSALLGRHISRSLIGAFAEEELLRLLHQILTRARIGHVQAVFVDQHGLLLEPRLPGFLRDALVDPFAELARQRRKIETFGFLAELRALNHASHAVLLLNRWGA